MLCPFCQEDVEKFALSEGGGLSCPRCSEDGVPVLYPMEYEQHPAVPVSIFGPTGHGKTVYIEALLTHLERRITWPGFSCQWMDQGGMLEARQRLLMLRQHGQLPDATAVVFPRPQVVRLRNIPAIGGCQLLFYDTGGETFRDVELLRDNGRYVKNCSAVLWLVSLNDIEYPEQLSDLMTTYAQAMVTMGASPSRQAIVVALTKGDLLLERRDLPPEAQEYLLNDNLNPSGDGWERLQTLSDALERWLSGSEHRNVVNLLKGQFRSVRWCIVSAQGTVAQDQVLDVELMPRGVLGPLFWLWRETRPMAWVSLADGWVPFFHLQKALDFAPAGSTVRLEATRYQVAEPLKVQRNVQIVGPGAASCIIESTAPDFTIALASRRTIEIRGMTFAHVGTTPAYVVRVIAGGVSMSECTIRGGVALLPRIQGDGVIVSNEATLSLHRCVLENNGGNGAASIGKSRLTVQGCTLRGNGWAGITAAGAEVDIQRCEVTENAANGIHLTESVKAKVHRTTCSRNRRNGIGAFNSALVELHNNVCEENRLDGIVAKDGTVLAADGNRCARNSQAGISLHDTVKGEVSNNNCQENKTAGIELEDRAAVNLLGNRSERNKRNGIDYSGSATGRCEGNRCMANESHGISVGGKAAPTIDRNTCTENGGIGLHVTANASPEIGRENTSANNTEADYHPPKLGRRGWFG